VKKHICESSLSIKGEVEKNYIDWQNNKLTFKEFYNNQIFLIRNSNIFINMTKSEYNKFIEDYEKEQNKSLKNFLKIIENKIESKDSHFDNYCRSIFSKK
jgi:hypothetical protein